MLVRPTTAPDSERFHALFAEVCAEGAFSVRDTPPPLARLHQTLLDVERLGLTHFVIEHDQALIGSIEIFPARYCGLQSAETEGSGYLGMQVRRPFRGQGLGRRLLDRALAHAREQGLRRVELQVFEDNQPALRLYRRAGFQWQADLDLRLNDGRPVRAQHLRLKLAA